MIASPQVLAGVTPFLISFCAFAQRNSFNNISQKQSLDDVSVTYTAPPV